jgi:hypothetical protein
VRAGGFPLELWLQLDDLRPVQIVVDARTAPDGPGLVVTTAEYGTLKLELSDGQRRTVWSCDPGLLVPGRRHQVVFNVDVTPRLTSVVVEGVLCDGGDHAQFSYTRYGDVGLKQTGKAVGDINGGPLRVAPGDLAGQLHHRRFYESYFTTTEMVGNFRAGQRLHFGLWDGRRKADDQRATAEAIPRRAVLSGATMFVVTTLDVMAELRNSYQ